MLESFLVTWIGLVACLHLWLSNRLIAAFRNRKESEISEQLWPSVLAVMALRGGDEGLLQALKQLMTLDYPDYRLRLVLDSLQDPACEIVRQALLETGFTEIEMDHLVERRKTCSGKISGILQGTRQLPAGCTVVAIFDGDAVLHPGCLKELVAPLTRDAVFTTGNRWYVPPPTLGAMTRGLWNALAVPMMNVMGIPWGGCMAMHADVIQHPELRRRLEIAFGEDSTIATFLLEQKQSIKFVPAATIINQESCTLQNFYNFLLRQYLTVRINNPRWKLLVFSNLALGVSVIGTSLLLCFSLSLWREVAVAFLALMGAVSVELWSGEYLVRREKSKKNVSVPAWSWKHWVILPTALVVLNYINLIATIHSMLVQTHIWRGITYRFPGLNRCEIVNVTEYAPQLMPPILTLENAALKGTALQEAVLNGPDETALNGVATDHTTLDVAEI